MINKEQFQEHTAIMDELKSAYTPITKIIGNNDFYYLDIPVHNNVGDLLIMYGTLAYFKKNKLKPLRMHSVHSFSEYNINDDQILVFHGGGNFGDLYPLHQQHRMTIISKYINNKIIVLPQTIYYESEEEYQACCLELRKHKDLHICVRDEKSYQLAQGMTNNVYLIPDMAHHLYTTELLQTDLELQAKTSLFLNRVDIEAVTTKLKVDADLTTDWSLFLSEHEKKVKLETRLQRLSDKVGLNKFTSKITTDRWLKLSEKLVREAVALYAPFEVIYTSRLHGCILSALMNKQTYVLDNSYGKNSAYLKIWLGKSPLIQRY